MEETIKVIIADDHAMVREGIRGFIESEPGFEIVGTAENGKQAVDLALNVNPDVVLMDLVMPVLNGIDAIRMIKTKKPDIKILVITSFSEDDKVFPAIKAGASGYLLKDTSPQQLIQAIQAVYNGESSLHPLVASKVLNELNTPSIEEKLTEQENNVLILIAQGLSNHDIAERLYLSENTIRVYTSKILGKLHLANRTQATLFALKEGLVNLGCDSSDQEKKHNDRM